MNNLLSIEKKSNSISRGNVEQNLAQMLLSRKEFVSEEVLITPYLASILLGANISNRPLSEMTVKAYALEMKKGKWVMNGQGIVISNKGILRDGQHRLQAVIEANVGVKMLVSSGVDDAAYKTLDTGQKRTAGQIFAIEGFKYGNAISGGIKEYLAYKKRLSMKQRLVGVNFVSNEEVFEWAIRYGKDKIEELANLTGQYYKENRFLGPSQILGCILVLDEIYPRSVWKTFMDKAFFGVGVANNTAEYFFIQRARKEANNPTKKTPPYIRKALFIKAFNSYITGKYVRLLSFDTEREVYPRFITEG